MASGGKGSKGSGGKELNEEPFTYHKVNNGFFLLLISIMIIMCLLILNCFSQVSDVAHGPLVTSVVKHSLNKNCFTYS